jgi:hypothetical protein
LTAIVAGDIAFLLAAPSASAGYATVGTPGSSWGKYMSSTQLSGTPLDNLFTDITGAQNAASQVDYACVFILNNTASGNSMLNTVLWLPTSANVAGGTTVTVGLDPAASTIKTSSTAQAATITAATNAPAGVSTWVSNTSTDPTSPSYTNGLQIGTIAPGYVKAFWVKRTATNSAPVNNDGFGWQIDFDTQA